MKTKDQTLLEEAYQKITTTKAVINESLFDRIMRASQEGDSAVEDIVQHTARAITFAINAIEDVTGEAGFEGIPETKQDNLYKAVEVLRGILTHED